MEERTLGTVWIVLPAYNEAAGLPLLLEAIGRAGRGAIWHTVVVDDGSRDETGAVARAFAGRMRLDVLTHPDNRGLAAAIRTGLEHACRLASPEDVIVTMDADNTHRPEQIPAMLAALRDGADVVIASRYVRGARQAGVPPHRALLSAGIGWLLRVRFGLPGVRDYSCGYRAFRAGLLQQALEAYGDRLIESQGFVVMTELLVKLAVFRPRIVEVPLDLRYDWKVGASKMPTGKTIAGYLRLMCAPPAQSKDLRGDSRTLREGRRGAAPRRSG
ncbi:MAG: glycosyltransferase [Armatimonadota bacterium]|nr:glycosyltransferase [Armatimonadota bacterium]